MLKSIINKLTNRVFQNKLFTSKLNFKILYISYIYKYNNDK